MDRLPLLISAPHAGLTVPAELTDLLRLSAQEIAEDGDEYARQVYAILKTEAAHFVTSDIARAFVDLNRAEDDICKDGVVKTHTCRNVPIYTEQLTPALIETLLERYHRPYHRRLTALGGGDSVLGVDCHTAAARGPDVGPDQGAERQQVCLSNIDGTCPAEWMEGLRACFQAHFPGIVTVNTGFARGYITRFHGREMPWVQLTLSQGGFAPLPEKSLWVLESLNAWLDMSNSPRGSRTWQRQI